MPCAVGDVAEIVVAGEASLAGEIGKAFDRLGSSVAEVKADNIAGAVAEALAARTREDRRHGDKP